MIAGRGGACLFIYAKSENNLMSGILTSATIFQGKRTAYIALGSNLASVFGGPPETIRAAVERLSGLGRITAQSSLYETDPVGFHGQPAFSNAVVALETQLEPTGLLQGMLVIEREFGRRRSGAIPNGPRTLDLDLLLIDDLTIASEELTVPHPALAERRFVLQPLDEIAPQLRHPVLRQTVRELLTLLPDSGENRISGIRQIEGTKGESEMRGPGNEPGVEAALDRSCPPDTII